MYRVEYKWKVTNLNCSRGDGGVSELNKLKFFIIPYRDWQKIEF